MKKVYYAWETNNGMGWIKMTGREFYDFIRLPENKHRKFIPSDDEEGIDGARIWFEVSTDVYKEWDRQRKRKARSHQANENVLSVFSLEDVVYMDSQQHILTWQDILSDEMETDHDEELYQLLYSAIHALEKEEQQILKKLFFERKRSEDTIAKELGVSQQVLNYRKKQILKRLRDFLIKTESEFL